MSGGVFSNCILGALYSSLEGLVGFCLQFGLGLGKWVWGFGGEIWFFDTKFPF